MFAITSLLQLAPALVNPNPIATPSDLPDWFDQIYEAIHTHQYYGLASLLLFGVMFGLKALVQRTQPTSKLGAFLHSDRGSMVVLLLTSLMGGFATAIGKGVKIDGPLIWTSIKAAGGATFLFAIVFKLLWPKDKAPLPAPAVPADPAVTPVTPGSAVVNTMKVALLFLGLGLSSCVTGASPVPTPTPAQYEIALTQCLKQDGLTDATGIGVKIFAILNSTGLTQAQIIQQVEALGISTGGLVLEQVAVCAIEAWVDFNPLTPGTPPTPSQAAARVVWSRHAKPSATHSRVLNAR